MGIFRKLWKGVKKVFKKIGKGIKKVVGKVGKFMDKIGIVGQIGLMFILPGIGGALMQGLTGAAATMTQSAFAFVRGAGAVLNTALKFATTAGNVYRTVTGAVTDFIGTAGKYIGGKMKLPGFENMSLGEAWGTYSNEVMKNVSSVIDPWKQAVTINPTFGSTVADQAKAVGMSPEQFVQNYTMPENVATSLEGLSGKELANFRFDSVQEQIFKPGQGPGAAVTASVITPITEPFQAVRNTDFWGFAPEQVTVTPLSTYDPYDTYSDTMPTGEYMRQQGATVGIGEVAPVEVKPPSFDEYDAYSDTMPTGEYMRRQQGLMAAPVDPSATQASVTALPDLEEQKSLYDKSVEYLRPVPGQVLTATGTNLLMAAVEGDPPPMPEPQEYFAGGTNFFQPSDQSFTSSIIGAPLRMGGPSGFGGLQFLSGTNTDPLGTVGGPQQWRHEMAIRGV